MPSSNLEGIMGAAVKVTRDDMTAGDLRKASGRVKDGKVGGETNAGDRACF